MHWTAQRARAALEIFNETASTGDACIRQRKEPLRLQKSSKKLLPLVTHAFDKQTARAALETFNETASTGSVQKPSTKLLPLVTHAFDSAKSPCGFRNLQRNCFHW
jgi:hypothetical protein